MPFIRQAIKLPDITISSVLKENLQGFRRARGYEKIHASDLTKEDFCPRRVALLDEAGMQPRKQYLSAALQATFDVGELTAKIFNERWAGQSVIGNWECTHCNTIYNFCRKPVRRCQCNKKADWEYKEVVFTHTETEAVGSIDAIFDLGNPKFIVTELKIIRPEDFITIVSPMAEHRERTNLYLSMIEQSDSVYKSSIDLTRAKVFYVSRGYGKKSGDLGILPFKEFDIEREPAKAEPYLDLARKIKLHRTDGTLPARICAGTADRPAKECEVCKSCFERKA